MRNTFNTKNTYENILTGINKEVINVYSKQFMFRIQSSLIAPLSTLFMYGNHHSFASQKGSSQINGSSMMVPGSVMFLDMPRALLRISI